MISIAYNLYVDRYAGSSFLGHPRLLGRQEVCQRAVESVDRLHVAEMRGTGQPT